MSALRKTIETTEHVEARKSWTPVVIVTEPATAPPKPEAAPEKGHMLRNMGLFLLAPFFGLLYAVLLPFVGVGMLAWIAAKAAWAEPKVREAVRFAAFMGKLLVAPLAGLAYIIAIPFVGVVLLTRAGARRLMAAPAA
jgi:hypothetical protein